MWPLLCSDTNTYWVCTFVYEETIGCGRFNPWPKELMNMKKLHCSPILLNNTWCFIYPSNTYWAPTILCTQLWDCAWGAGGRVSSQSHGYMWGTDLQEAHDQEGLKVEQRPPWWSTAQICPHTLGSVLPKTKDASIRRIMVVLLFSSFFFFLWLSVRIHSVYSLTTSQEKCL